MWRTCHGSLTSTGGAAAAEVQEEALTFSWLRLKGALNAIAAAAPQISSLPETAQLAGIADQVPPLFFFHRRTAPGISVLLSSCGPPHSEFVLLGLQKSLKHV